MESLEKYHHIYFIGIGGIGMSALARYFHFKKIPVSGYDKTPSPLTDELISSGIPVHFEDWGEKVLQEVKSPENTLIIFTPAVPHDLGELVALRTNGYQVIKRAEALGIITNHTKGLTVAGTHGKTTTSTLLAHLLHETIGCNAFLGGISSNYRTNYLFSADSPYTVIEADEFDHSFLHLTPFASVITAIDPDHLDIYGDAAHFQQGFQDFANKISEDGFLIIHSGFHVTSKCRQYTYAVNQSADYEGSNLHYENGIFKFDIKTPKATYKNVELGVPGIHNAENALADFAICEQLGFDMETLRPHFASFRGVQRRFDYHVKTEKLVYIDDYAHHPTEIKALIDSVHLLYPKKHKLGIFQPHLYTRTRDFMDGFAEQLSRLDEVILLPIYPARELPIEGITSEALLEKITCEDKKVLSKEATIEYLKTIHEGIIMTIGAGNIDRLVPILTENFKQQ